MILCRGFSFAAPPRTGTTWLLHALAAGGLGEFQKTHAHEPWAPSAGRGSYRLTFVRDPAEWLASYWANIFPGKVGVPAVDVFRLTDQQVSFPQFAEMYLERAPGRITQMFNAYEANSVIKMEDLPHAMDEFLESMGVPQAMRDAVAATEPQNVTPYRDHPVINPVLRENILSAEAEFSDRYNYDLV